MGTNRFRMKLLAIVLLSLSVIPVSGWADTLITLINNPFNESLLPAPKISSAGRGMVVGVDVQNIVSKSPLAVLASLPRDWSGLSVCLVVLSSSGLYIAQNTYEVKSSDAGFVDFPFNTKFQTQLEQLDSQDIAVSVSLGPCNTDQPEVFFVGAWRKPATTKNHTIRVLIYSQQAEEVFLYDDTAQTETRCVPWKDKTVYDFVCYWEPDFSASKARQMEVLTVRDGDTEATDQFVVQLGAGL